MEFTRRHDPPNEPIRLTFDSRISQPESLEELVALVQEAEAQPQHMPVRPLGSLWSLSEANLTGSIPDEQRGFFVDTARLNKTIPTVLDACLSAPMRAHLIAQSRAGSPWDNLAFYHVEGGIKIHDLYARLDGLDDRRDPDWRARWPLPSVWEQGDPDLFHQAWAVPTLGGAGGQSIVGAFTTGTHGADVNLAPVADAVRAVHLVGAGGQQYWIERGPYTDNSPGDYLYLTEDDDLLRSRLGVPDLLVYRDEALLRAVTVSMGRLGVIYAVVLDIVPQYAFHVTRSSMPWSTARAQLSEFMRDSHQVTVAINPHARHDNPNEHDAYVTRWTYVRPSNETVGRAERRGPRLMDGSVRDNARGVPYDQPDETMRPVYQFAGNSVALDSGDFQSSVCAQVSAEAFLNPIVDTTRTVGTFLIIVGTSLAVLGGGAGAPLIATGFVLHASADAVTAEIASAPPGASLGELTARVLNRHVALAPLVNTQLLNAAQYDIPDCPKKLRIGYAAQDTYNYLDRACLTYVKSFESVLDASALDVVPAATMLDTFMRDLIRAVRAVHTGADPMLGGRGVAYGGYFSLRITKPTSAFLGMQQFPVNAHVEVSTLGNLEGADHVVGRAQEIAVGVGGCVHWGQYNTLSAGQVQRMYYFIEEWRAQLAKVSDNGRSTTFASKFTAARGLEVAQPLIAAFEPRCQHWCAGEQLQLQWDATANPPATTLVLQRKEGRDHWNNVESLALQSGADNGYTTVRMRVPEGRTTIRLRAEHTLAGREYTSYAPHFGGVEVIGYGPLRPPIGGFIPLWMLPGSVHVGGLALTPNTNPELNHQFEEYHAFSAQEWSSALTVREIHVFGLLAPLLLTIVKDGVAVGQFGMASSYRILSQPIPIVGRWGIQLFGGVASPPRVRVIVRVTC